MVYKKDNRKQTILMLNDDLKEKLFVIVAIESMRKHDKVTLQDLINKVLQEYANNYDYKISIKTPVDSSK